MTQPDQIAQIADSGKRMTSIPSQIGSSSFKRSRNSAAAMPQRSLSSVRKAPALLSSQATIKGAESGERSTTCPNGSTVARFGNVIVDFSGPEAYKGRVRLPFAAHEFRVLRYFIDNPGRVICRHELLDKVWGYNAYPTTQTVDNQIFNFRHKLEVNPEKPAHFVTVHGIGYSFVKEEFDSGLYKLQSSIRRNTGRKSTCDSADFRNVIFGYLSGVYESLVRNCPQGQKPRETTRSMAKAWLLRRGLWES
jgi:DNA-binding winged helix-turn-helix (wHTH) protein